MRRGMRRHDTTLRARARLATARHQNAEVAADGEAAAAVVRAEAAVEAEATSRADITAVGPLWSSLSRSSLIFKAGAAFFLRSRARLLFQNHVARNLHPTFTLFQSFGVVYLQNENC